MTIAVAAARLLYYNKDETVGLANAALDRIDERSADQWRAITRS